MVLSVINGGLSGAAAALAVGLILAADEKFTGLGGNDDSIARVKSQVMIIATGVIAGFAGISLLRRMSVELGADVERLKGDVRETRQEIAQGEVATLNLSAAMSMAALTLSKSDSMDTSTKEFRLMAAPVIEKLIKSHRDYPRDRSIAVFLGRLYRRVGDLDRACQVLRETLGARQASRQATDSPNKDDAVMHYNMACYLNLLARESKTEGRDLEAANYRARAKKRLDMSVSICPEFIEDAKGDEDILRDLELDESQLPPEEKQ